MLVVKIFILKGSKPFPHVSVKLCSHIQSLNKNTFYTFLKIINPLAILIIRFSLDKLLENFHVLIIKNI